MELTVLHGTDLRVSRFVFGTASLFNVGTRKKRLALLHAARDHGFRHFDTAPYYGFGIAESDLKSLLETDRNLTVTTKVGIYPPGGTMQRYGSVFLRKAAGRIIPTFSRPTIDWSLESARRSLESSLRRLGRATVDILLLHEPNPQLVATDEWRKWLEQEVKKGRVRHFGVALGASSMVHFSEFDISITSIVQSFDSIAGMEADITCTGGRQLQLTYGYVSAAVNNGQAVDVTGILRAALKRNSTGAILVSTRKITRIKQYAELAGNG